MLVVEVAEFLGLELEEPLREVAVLAVAIQHLLALLEPLLLAVVVGVGD